MKSEWEVKVLYELFHDSGSMSSYLELFHDSGCMSSTWSWADAILTWYSLAVFHPSSTKSRNMIRNWLLIFILFPLKLVEKCGKFKNESSTFKKEKQTVSNLSSLSLKVYYCPGHVYLSALQSNGHCSGAQEFHKKPDASTSNWPSSLEPLFPFPYH